MIKLKRLVIAALAVMCGLVALSFGTHAVHAVGGNTEIIIHKRVFPTLQNDGTKHANNGEQLGANSELLTKTEGLNGVTYDIYDATPQFIKSIANNQSSADFVSQYSDMSHTAATEVAAEMTKVGSVTTAHDSALKEDGVARISLPTRDANGHLKAYYMLERSVTGDVEVNITQTQPLMLIMGVKNTHGQEINPLHIYAKNDAYARDPYFFKFGIDREGGKHRLEGAEFVFTKIGDNGKTLYLAADQPNTVTLNWLESSDPANDPLVARFVSDKNGLVATPGIFVPSGDYRFYEVKAPAGYILDETPINVHIPSRHYDENGNELFVTVNGVKIVESASGILSEGIIKAAEARVYNYMKKPGKPTEPGKPGEPGQPGQPGQPGTPGTNAPGGSTGGSSQGTGGGSRTPTRGGFFPQLGNEASALLLILGLALMTGAVMVWRKRRAH